LSVEAHITRATSESASAAVTSAAAAAAASTSSHSVANGTTDETGATIA